jgi:hypothetical protein
MRPFRQDGLDVDAFKTVVQIILSRQDSRPGTTVEFATSVTPSIAEETDVASASVRSTSEQPTSLAMSAYITASEEEEEEEKDRGLVRGGAPVLQQFAPDVAAESIEDASPMASGRRESPRHEERVKGVLLRRSASADDAKEVGLGPVDGNSVASARTVIGGLQDPCRPAYLSHDDTCQPPSSLSASAAFNRPALAGVLANGPDEQPHEAASRYRNQPSAQAGMFSGSLA